jgi:hypothetical protein
MGGWDQNGFWEDWLGRCEVASVGLGLGPVAGSCEHGDEPSGSGAKEFVSKFVPMVKRTRVHKRTVFPKK